MRLPGQELIGNVGSLSVDDLRLSAELHGEVLNCDREFRHIYFAAHGERGYVESQPFGDVTRASYILFNGVDALFTGLKVRKALRGQGLGRYVFDFFQAHMESEGLNFTGTARIHKPGIALILTRAGLRPRSERCLAELLPAESAADVPRVRFLRQRIAKEDMKRSSSHGDFYRVVPRNFLKGVPVNTDRVVALHTAYSPQ